MLLMMAVFYQVWVANLFVFYTNELRERQLLTAATEGIREMPWQPSLTDLA